MYKINLLPHETSKVKDRSNRFRLLILLLPLFFLVAGYGIFLYQHHCLKNELLEIDREIEDIATRVAYAEGLKKEKEIRELRLSSLYEVMNDRKEWSPVLLKVKDIVFNGIIIEQINIDSSAGGNGTVTIEGSAEDVMSAGLFLEKLKEIKLFCEVELNHIRKNQEDEKAVFKFTAYTGEVPLIEE